MSLDVFFRRDLRAHILAAVVFAIRGAQRQGSDPQFIAGVLAALEHNALALAIDWPGVLKDAKIALGSGVAQLIDQALTLAPGARIEG